MKTRSTSLLMVLFVYIFAFLIFTMSKSSFAQESQNSETTPQAAAPAPKAKKFNKLYAQFETSMGNFKVILFHRYAPNTVENFRSLVEGTKKWRDPKTNEMVATPFYNNLIFHRVRKNFMIQAGDPYLDGRTDVGFFIKDEFHSNLKHNKPGILSMANQYPEKDSNSTQFFITLKAFEGKNTLDNVNTIFGEVIEGMEIVQAIGNVPINRLNDRPVKDVVIKSVTMVYE